MDCMVVGVVCSTLGFAVAAFFAGQCFAGAIRTPPRSTPPGVGAPVCRRSPLP